MAKDKDQPEKTEETLTPEQIAEQKAADAQEVEAQDAAVKASEDFDNLADESDDVEETPLEKEDEQLEADDKAEKEDVEETPSDEPGDDDGKGKKDGESEISDEMRKRATDLGMVPEEIAKFKDDAELVKSVEIMENIRDDDGDEEQEAPAPKPAKPEVKKDGDEQKPADPSELVIENEDEMDPGIVKIMKAQHKKNYELEQKLAEQGEKFKAGEDRLEAERNKVAMERFDEKIAALGKDYHDTFGQGGTLGMSTRSTARKNRNKLGRHMVALGNAMVEAGDEVTSESLFEMALNNVFQEKVEAIKGAKLHAKTSKRSRQRIGRGDTKKTGKPTRQQAAVQVSEEFDELIDASEDVN